MIAPTIVDFSTVKIYTFGTDKSVPYELLRPQLIVNSFLFNPSVSKAACSP